MAPRDPQSLVQVMKDMASLEIALATLYDACSERFPEDRNFWLAIKHQEELHAGFIAKLIELISAHPDQFRFGRPFNSVAVRTIQTNVAGYTEQVRQGKLDRKRALFIAKDIENSVLEANYREIVGTDNVEFQQIIARIEKDTLAHKNLFAAKVAKSRT